MKVLEAPALSYPNQEMEALLEALIALRRGDASVRLPSHWTGVAGKLADVFNDLGEQNATMASELARLRQVVNTANAPAEKGFRYMPETGEERYSSFCGVPVQRLG